jgi:hypothetical protein
MRIEVYDEEKEAEKVLMLRLVKQGAVAVLRAVDTNGNKVDGGNILEISEYGISRLGSCRAGFPVDGEGRVTVS